MGVDRRRVAGASLVVDQARVGASDCCIDWQAYRPVDVRQTSRSPCAPRLAGLLSGLLYIHFLRRRLLATRYKNEEWLHGMRFFFSFVCGWVGVSEGEGKVRKGLQLGEGEFGEIRYSEGGERRGKGRRLTKSQTCGGAVPAPHTPDSLRRGESRGVGFAFAHLPRTMGKGRANRAPRVKVHEVECLVERI